MSATVKKLVSRLVLLATFVGMVAGAPQLAFAAQPEAAAAAGEAPVHRGGEASLVVPDLSSVSFLGIDGHTLLMSGLVVAALVAHVEREVEDDIGSCHVIGAGYPCLDFQCTAEQVVRLVIMLQCGRAASLGHQFAQLRHIA